MKKRKRFSLILIMPLLCAVLYSGLRYGYISPMIKGVDIRIIGGTFITNINKYVIKVGDKVGLSAGDYVVAPAFSKTPKLKFAVLDDSGVLTIEDNHLIAKKEGYSSIGVLNGNRVLRKAAIMVVNPKIKNMQVDLEKPLKYYGDKSKIDSSVNIDDYKKLEKGYKLNYSVTNPKVLKIENDVVEAIGVGESRIIARYDRKEIQTSVKISPRIDKIDVKKLYELEEGQSLNLGAKVETSPKTTNTPIAYEVFDNIKEEYKGKKYDDNKKVYSGESGIEQKYGIEIDKNGNLKANMVGRYLVKLSSGNKEVETTVEVEPRSFKNLEIRNLAYSVNEKNKEVIDINLGCDFNSRVNIYKIYIKSKNDSEFKLLTSIRANKNSLSSGRRVVQNLELPRVLDYDYQLYMVGSNGEEETQKSNIVDVSEKLGEEFQQKKLQNLRYFVDRENSTVSFTWDPLDGDIYTYRIYAKDHKNKNYSLIAKNIKKTRSTIKINDHSIDREYRVLAINNFGQISNLSDPVRVSDFFSE